MALYCNENVKLRVGGRKAPVGGKEKLEILLEKDEDGVNQKLYDFIGHKTKLSEKFLSDLKYNVSGENLDDNAELRITKSGVYFISAWIAGDWEIPVQIFIYWDGKNYRGYIPTKGNCINLLNKSAFGNDEDLDSNYLIKEFGSDVGTDNLDIDLAACIEDFESRLEVEGEIALNAAVVTPKSDPKRNWALTMTTPQESLELLKLGITIESADHLYHNPNSELRREVIYIDDDPDTKEALADSEFDEKSDFIPAWSATRLIEIFLKNANTKVAKVDYIVSGSDLDSMKDIAYKSLLKQLKK